MRIRLGLLCCLVAPLLGCSRTGSESGPAGGFRLLIDGRHAPDILVGGREIARPPAVAGSRFLAGWRPGRAAGGEQVLFPVLAPASARLELVNLGRKASTLVIDFAGPAGALRGRVRVRCGGRDLGVFPLADPLRLPLPLQTLPLGRVPVDLTFHSSQDSPPGVRAAALLPASGSGFGRVEGADLVQAGDSLADLVFPASGDLVLAGAFEPPASPRAGQRFELALEREDGTVAGRFSWSTSWSSRIRGRRKIELRLRNATGFLRVRLRAVGQGPAARWKSLGVAGTPTTEPIAGAAARAPQPPPPRLVVVYVLDALRADRVGAEPGAASTCGRLAAEGMAFESHRSVAPNTLPSTKALFTGTTFLDRGGWKLAPEEGETLAELFRSHGYRTGLFSGNVQIGPAFGTDRGFEHVAADVGLEEYGPGPRPPFNGNAARVNASALRWLRSLPPGAKAFLYLHTLHPHNPYDPPEPFRSRFTRGIGSTIDGGTTTLVEIKQKRITPTAADRERLRGLYTGAFAYADFELERFVAGLATWAPRSETLVAITSDHGEELFEHGGILHGYTLYEEMLRIPLILWAPGRLRTARIAAATDTLDLRATLLDLAGIARDGTAEGRSLLQAVRRGEREPEVHLAAASSVKGGIYAAQSARFKLIWAPRTGAGWGMGEGIGRSREPEYLFDLARDPGETVNLAGHGGFEAAWLRSRLLAWIEHGRGAPKGSEPAPLDRETRDRLRALGYLN